MTLLEVLVSLAIFALAAICLGAAYANTVAALHQVADMEKEAGDWRAVRLALLSEPDRRKVEQGGDMQLPDNRRITWSVDVGATAVIDLFEVRLFCRMIRPDGREQVHEEVFRVLRPTWSEAGERQRMLEAAKQRRVIGAAR